MNKIKHSKIKNTGILFELLTRQITVDILNGNNSGAVVLLKKYFSEKTELGKEYKLYEFLLKSTYKSENKANSLIDAVISARQKLHNSVLRREKYNLIKEIKEKYDVTEFFKSKLPNYKAFASIYKVLQSESTPEKFNPKETTDSRYSIVEHIVGKKVIANKKSEKLVENYKKQDKDLRLLSYKILVDKFNSKYKSLNASQKNLLKEYINNISNTNSLKEFIGNEGKKVKKILAKYVSKVDDKITKIKLNEAVKQVDSLTKGRFIKDKQVISLMRYYELIKEIRSVIKRV
jgi:hypothetical protein